MLCPPCRYPFPSANREFTNGSWHRLGNIITRPEGKLTRGAKQFRADLERAVANIPEEFADKGDPTTGMRPEHGDEFSGAGEEVSP